MFRTAATLRISLTLASVTLCSMLVALALGLLPDRAGALADGRRSLCEAVTVSCSLAVGRGDRSTVNTVLEAVANRNPELISIALRRSNGKVYSAFGEHETHWSAKSSRSTLTHMHVPIYISGNQWGQLEICFLAPSEQNFTWVPTSVLFLTAFVVSASFLGQFLYLRKILRHLDPSKVIPERVRETLDSLAEGLLVLDKDQRIVLANASFAQTVGQSAEELQGHIASDLPWAREDEAGAGSQPWEKSIQDGVVETGHLVKLGEQEALQRTLQVNSAPIRASNGESRGALATFSDVTALEVRNEQLGETLTKLKRSRDQISEQNERLRNLAMVDPLTQCLNRRAFFEELDNQVATAQRTGQSLCYIILDIDRFKMINDNHGHKTGDEVLQQTAALLRETVGELGYICRYGGEEFSILLPELGLDLAEELAEALRTTIETTPISALKVTASFGLVQFDVGSPEPLQALDQADKALYHAKRSGRNQVMRWDRLPANLANRENPRAPGVSAATSV